MRSPSPIPVTTRSLPSWSVALFLSTALALSFAPGAALAADGADWLHAGGGARLVDADGATLYATSNQVVGERAIELADAGLTLLLWDEESAANRSSTSHYAIFEGGELLGRVRETSYDVGLVRNAFDPLAAGEPARAPHLSARSDNRIFLVQSWVPPIAKLQERVRAAGGTIHRFLTDHTLIVEMDGSARPDVAALPFVRWVGPYHPAYRVEPPLRPLLENGFRDQSATERYSIMVFERGARQQDELSDVVRALGGQVEVTTPQGFRMEATLTPAQLAELVHDNRVHYVDVWGPGGHDMGNVRITGGADYVEANTPLPGYTGQGVRGEIFDTENRGTHQEWAVAPIIHSTGTSGGSHGTAVMSNVFAQGIDADARGMCPDGQPIFFRYNESTQFGGPISRYDINAELIDPVGPYRAVFQTSSVGNSRTFFYTTISAETDDYLFLHQLLSTQSQSNAGNQDSRPQAWAKNIVSVGGFRHFNNADRSDDRWGGSASIGPADDGRIKPDLSFYYDSIWSASPSSDTSYSNFGGTSSATPQTAGHFGLLFQLWHEGVWTGFGGGTDVFDSRPNMVTAKALMIHNAYQYDWLVAGPNDDLDRFKQGWGTADVRNLLDNAPGTNIVDEAVILTQGETHEVIYSLPAPSDYFKATLVYVDPMGNPAAAEARINDLTLKVTAPDSTIYWGNNGLTAGLTSTSGGVSNTIDTVENVFLENVSAGDWTVEVIADEIVEDAHLETAAIVDADFALVVSFDAAAIFADGFESGDTTLWSTTVP